MGNEELKKELDKLKEDNNEVREREELERQIEKEKKFKRERSFLNKAIKEIFG